MQVRLLSRPIGSPRRIRSLHVADRAAPLHDRSFRSELCRPDWAKEIDFQFDRSEGFLRRECACKRHSHRGVSNVAMKRSEEHTSELQSRLHLVCRLLLEKKKKTNIQE